jgi:Fur family ferric uptake transcriptional regulator
MTGSSTRRLLRASGLQATQQRALVLELLAGRSRPVTAQQLHTELQNSGSAIGLTTVYRALHVMADAGLLHVLEVGGESAYRRCGPDRHHHLICRICGLVTEGPPLPKIEEWLARLPEELRFLPERHRVEVHGLCASCADENRA